MGGMLTIIVKGANVFRRRLRGAVVWAIFAGRRLELLQPDVVVLDGLVGLVGVHVIHGLFLGV